MDPNRGSGTIQPTVQGMTVNAGKGPPSPPGKILQREDRGSYSLLALPSHKLERAALSPRRAQLLTESELRARVVGLIDTFDACVAQFDHSVPFTKVGQYEWHRLTLDRRRLLGTPEAAARDDTFTTLLYHTLQAWGIGQRSSIIISLEDFRSSLNDHTPELAKLGSLSLEHLQGANIATEAAILDRLINDLRVVENRARIVAGTKTLHHLLPDLVPPMDRAWTGTFFGWSTLDPQNHQRELLEQALASLAEVARAKHPSRLVGEGWKTSPTKVLDNAVIGYCQLQGIG
jgi:hypothetical protein